MDVSTAVRQRRSVRRFAKQNIPADIFDALIEALIRAPSAGNLQSRKFFVVSEKGLKQRIAAAALQQSFIAEAPVAIVCCADSRIRAHYGPRGVELYAIQDVAASIMCMMLVAVEKGLGTCWVGAFQEEEVSRVLDLPAMLRPVAIVPVGYPDRVPGPTPRVSRDEAIEFRR